MTVESLHNKGMYYTDIPLQEGYVKTLLNYDISGTTLTPRGGLKEQYVDKTSLASLVNASDKDNDKYAILATGTTYIEEHDGTDATLYRYALIGKCKSTNVTDHKFVNLTNTKLFVFPASISLEQAVNGSAFFCTYTGPTTMALGLKQAISNIHGINVAEELQSDSTLEFLREANYASLSGNVYFTLYNTAYATDDRYRLGRLVITKSATTGVAPTWTIEELVPKDVQPIQAINYGYNMLKKEPYTFTNTTTTVGGLQLNGIIPKDSAGNIVFTSKVGEEVTFHLNYQYPATDKDAKKYLVQWEFKDLSSDTNPTTIQQVRKSTAYTPGDAITLKVTPAFKQFAVIIKVYYKDEVDAYTFVSDADDYDKLTPIKSLVLASYYLTAETNSSMRNVTPIKYNLPTCKGMCVWQQRLVMWGVTGAESTLFVSEPNAPEYIPYPNNSEMFTERIVHAVPYMGKLLVFTSNSVYLLTFNADGLTYTTKCVQDNLVMLEDDSSTIRTVRNMVYFRSGNHYHMIVPNTSAGVGEVQLAPISKPISTFLDDFRENVIAIIDEVYNIRQIFNLKEANDEYYELKLCDYTNYLEGNKMLNVYKCAICVYNLVGDKLVLTKYYADFVLAYDTVLRTWTAQFYETSPTRAVPFIQNVADNTSYITVAPGKTSAHLLVYKADSTDITDEITLYTDNVPKHFYNYQLLDTGNRSHNAQLKKRFREIQMSINNVQKTKLDFYTTFLVDDDTRRDMFRYETQHITDTTDPNYGLVFVERIMSAPITTWGETLFTEEGDDTGWTIDFSRFPHLTVAKVHLKVTGKGYNGRLKVLSKNITKYEILTTNWVYRPMYGR